MTSVFTMYDDVDVALIPTDAHAVAYYVDGRFANLGAVKARCPNAQLLPIITQNHLPPLTDIVGWHHGICFDGEPGDLTPAQLAALAKQALNEGARPVDYGSLSNIPSHVAAMNALGIKHNEVEIFSAHYNNVAHRCLQIPTIWGLVDADATQFTDRALGRSLDESECRDGFLVTPKPAPQPVPQEPGLSPNQRLNFWRIWNHNPSLPKDDTLLSEAQRHLYDAIWNAGWNAAKHHH